MKEESGVVICPARPGMCEEKGNLLVPFPEQGEGFGRVCKGVIHHALSRREPLEGQKSSFIHIDGPPSKSRNTV
jgi:hypothetical protein